MAPLWRTLLPTSWKPCMPGMKTDGVCWLETICPTAAECFSYCISDCSRLGIEVSGRGNYALPCRAAAIHTFITPLQCFVTKNQHCRLSKGKMCYVIYKK